MNTRASGRTRLGTAIGMCLASLLAFQAAHASGDGSLVGRLNASDASTVQGAEITARNPATGFSRTYMEIGRASCRERV